MLLLGSRSDVEIHRCRSSIAATPRYQEYLGRANAFRERSADLLYRGRFLRLRVPLLSNPEIQTNAFLLGNELGVLLTQSNRDVQKTEVSVPGFRFVRMDSVSGDVVFENTTVTIPRNGFALLVYRKE